jgi:hypothetical protein
MQWSCCQISVIDSDGTIVTRVADGRSAGATSPDDRRCSSTHSFASRRPESRARLRAGRAEFCLAADLLNYPVMAADPRARELLELMSRTVEAHPGADARTLRVRAGVKRLAGDKALELLERAGFIERKQVASAQDAYHSLKPYRASVEAPRTAFAKTYSVRQGGT